MANAIVERLCMMAIEEERRKSFKYWPFKGKSKCSIERMAEAGFFSSGKKSEADLASCYVCHKELDGWEPEDDPWSEHQKHAALCPFIKLQKKPSELTVGDILYLQKESMVRLMHIDFNKKTEILKDENKIILEELEAGLKENEKPKTGGRKRSSRK